MLNPFQATEWLWKVAILQKMSWNPVNFIALIFIIVVLDVLTSKKQNKNGKAALGAFQFFIVYNFGTHFVKL